MIIKSTKPLLTVFIFILLVSSAFSQYEDTGNRGLYFEKKKYSGVKIPLFNESKSKLPVPVLEDNREYIDLYWKAWELAFNHYKKPPAGSPFVSDFIDEAFSPSIFQWDTIFMLMFARYANHIFPAIQSLDNFYCRQYENGYICREIQEADGADYVFIGRQHTVNPPLFSWAEVESYKVTGDKSRFKMVLPVIEKYTEWLEKYRKKDNTKHGLYWQTGLGSGMDNTPRSGSGWTDMSCQIVMLYNDMATMCDELELKEKSAAYKIKAGEIGERINKFMWNEEDGLYYDLDDKGEQIKRKTSACFWPMLAGITDEAKANKLVRNLRNPKLFWTKIPFPTLSADDKDYRGEGEYWLGSVWAPTNVMIIKGLEKCGYHGFEEFAALSAEAYLDGMTAVFKKTGTIWENYSSEAYSSGSISKPDFVGWSGCGPIELLIENIIGIRPEGAKNKITWLLNRIDRHGIENLTFGDVNVSLVCRKRESITSGAIIEIESSKPFELEVIKNDLKKNFKLVAGKQIIELY